VIVRPERAEDRGAVREVNRDAFGRAAEADLVDALRRSPAFIPELSLVALDGTQVVGHVLFTRIVVRGERHSHPALALAPLAVLGLHQRRGVGSALVERGFEHALALGHALVIVLGHPEYYPRFGFVPAGPHGIRAPFAVREEAFLARELRPGVLGAVQGQVEYPPEFAGSNEQAPPSRSQP
jgi:putative acetyltransferase